MTLKLGTGSPGCHEAWSPGFEKILAAPEEGLRQAHLQPIPASVVTECLTMRCCLAVVQIQIGERAVRILLHELFNSNLSRNNADDVSNGPATIHALYCSAEVHVSENAR